MNGCDLSLSHKAALHLLSAGKSASRDDCSSRMPCNGSNAKRNADCTTNGRLSLSLSLTAAPHSSIGLALCALEPLSLSLSLNAHLRAMRASGRTNGPERAKDLKPNAHKAPLSENQ